MTHALVYRIRWIMYHKINNLELNDKKKKSLKNISKYMIKFSSHAY